MISLDMSGRLVRVDVAMRLALAVHRIDPVPGPADWIEVDDV